MRLSSICRRALYPSTPLRAGVPPIWDRPDPPASKKVPTTKRYTMEQKHFSFFDGASPSYMLVNSEVAEGDPIEAFPLLIKRLSILGMFAFLAGSIGFLWASQQQQGTLFDFDAELIALELTKKQADSKYGMKDMLNNPWKLNVWPEVYPKHLHGDQLLTTEYTQKTETVAIVRKVNGEALAYWNALYKECQKALAGGVAHH